ncbi:hypothetical protein NC652_039541 [Populus alba x Populus x berolinensis]|nr:hypothetical protein NC652_039541 [Populus alba x Populus x berolinensis]
MGDAVLRAAPGLFWWRPVGADEGRYVVVDGGGRDGDRWVYGRLGSALFYGGRSRFVSEREAAPLGKTRESGQERVVLWSTFKGRGQLLLGSGRKDR